MWNFMTITIWNLQIFIRNKLITNITRKSLADSLTVHTNVLWEIDLMKAKTIVNSDPWNTQTILSFWIRTPVYLFKNDGFRLCLFIIYSEHFYFSVVSFLVARFHLVFFIRYREILKMHWVRPNGISKKWLYDVWRTKEPAKGFNSLKHFPISWSGRHFYLWIRLLSVTYTLFLHRWAHTYAGMYLWVFVCMYVCLCL